MTQRRREIRHRRDSDAACDEERADDVQIEAVSERPQNVNRLAGLECAKRTCAGPNRVDQERELTGRRLAQAHRAREHSSGSLEHEELAGNPRLELSPLESEQCVRPNLLRAQGPELLAPDLPTAK
jgi:hypothetical protein